MKPSEAWRSIASITASQWGMITTSQAEKLGISRLKLSRLTKMGHLERVMHGVYRDAAAPPEQFDSLRAAWLSVDPEPLAEARIRDLVGGVVAASTSAALLHDIGDLWGNHHEFVTTRRRQSQRHDIRFRHRQLDEQDITIRHGLPVMTRERTIADLLEDTGEMSLTANALGEAAKMGPLDFTRLRELVTPLANRYGFRRHDGEAVIAHLLHLEGFDETSITNGVLAHPASASLIPKSIPQRGEQ